jgi:hypothetical protein
VNGITDGYEKEVETLLDEYGELISFEIPRSVRDKFAKGEFRMLYAIATFRNKHHAEEAISGLTGREVGPRKLRLKWDRPPPHAQGGAREAQAAPYQFRGERERSDRGGGGYSDYPRYGKGGKGDNPYGGGKGDYEYGRGKGDRYGDYYGGGVSGGGGGGKGDYEYGRGKGDYYGGGKGDYYAGGGKGDYEYGRGKGDRYGDYYAGGKGDYYAGGGKGDYEYGRGKGDRYGGGGGGYDDYPPPPRRREETRDASPPPIKRQRPWETAAEQDRPVARKSRDEILENHDRRNTVRKQTESDDIPRRREEVPPPIRDAARESNKSSNDKIESGRDTRVDANSIFVRNLDFDLRERDIKDHFEKTVGRVLSLELVRDPEGRSRGFGFIEFSSVDEQLRALKSMDGSTLNGRNMIVQKVEPKARKAFHDRQEALGSGGGGGGGGGGRRPLDSGRDVFYGESGGGYGKGSRGDNPYGGKGYDDDFGRGKGGGYGGYDRGGKGDNYGGKGGGKGYERGRGYY